MLTEKETRLLIEQLIDDFLCITAFCTCTERLLNEHKELDGKVFTSKEKETMINTILRTAQRRKDIEEILKREGGNTEFANPDISNDEVKKVIDSWASKSDTLTPKKNDKILH